MPIPVAYPSREEIITAITLRISEDQATLIWPPMPRWASWIGVATIVLAATVNTFLLVRLARTVTVPQLPPGARLWLEITFAICLAGLVLGAGIAIHFALWISRFGKSPKLEIAFGNGEYSVTKPGFRTMKYRRYSLETLKSLEVKPVADIFFRHRSFVLILHPHKGSRKRFPFSTGQSDLPALIEEALSRHLQISRLRGPLAQKDET